jgi:hypothetical protein
VDDRFADVTTQELIDELATRCDTYALGCVLKGDQRKDDTTCVSVWYGGSLLSAMGIAEWIRTHLRSEMEAAYSEDDDAEPA